MTNIEKAQEYLNNLEAEMDMDMAMDKVKSLPNEVFSPSHPYYIAATTAAIKYNTAFYMMKLMTDAMLEQHNKDRNKEEKKYRYHVGQSAEGCTTGTILLTKAQAAAVEFATNTNNWDNLDVESYSGDFSIYTDRSYSPENI